MEDGVWRIEDGGWGMMVVVARVFVAEDLDTSSILEAGEIHRILV